jgi:hypothetical protein
MHLTKANREMLIVFLSLTLQVPLAVFLSHYYDGRVFMATGYLVDSGLNPYQQHELSNVYPSPVFAGAIPSIGYPPPWPLVLGLVYHLSFGLIPNIFLYNFAIKIPVIIGNVCLAYLVRSVLLKSQATRNMGQKAWLFLLFNPFIMLTTAAWGQFDTIVAFLCVASFYFLSEGMIESCALSLAVGVALKPIALPLVPLPLLFPALKSRRKKLCYLLVFTAILLVCSVVPFFLLGWSIPLGPSEWNAQFKMAGGMSPLNIIELFQGSTVLPSGLELLGFFWVPAVIVGYFALSRNRPNSIGGLAQKALGIALVFFLTRSWLSEPNINLILPFMLLTAVPGQENFRNFHFAWTIPLLFMFLNTSIPQLFFLVYPSVLTSLAQLDQQILGARLVARFLVAVLWQVYAWNVAIKMLSRKAIK